ncbi:N-acetylmuramoyl-L-alanine amidase [Candidatus Poribacteria bacterium]|nr:N-acetylmuramoyl-L-alanine amidase [Candidatus Poribacteria bacterium]
MSRLILQFIIIPILIFSFSDCDKTKNIILDDNLNFEIPSYTRHLKDLKICLDPGHGGQGHIPDYKRGPTGLREAVINLKVANHLREFLEGVGVQVIMTRTDDSYVSLADRSKISNDNDSDIFISLHHNGIANPETNYTSTWYHGDADESRSSLDLARYIQQGVTDALQLPKTPSTGLYSDKLIVASGFGVLRLTECTAVVCEASFYTNPEEEERLKDENYLKKEAYGYFLGIARYAEAGFPKGVLITPGHNSVIESKTPKIQISVMDGLHERGAWMLKRQQIYSNSIQVRVDNEIVPFKYDSETDIININIKEKLSNGVHYIQTDLVNYYGNHSLTKPQKFKIAPPANNIEINAWTDNLPYDGMSYVGINVKANDADGLPIADDEILQASTTHGELLESTDTSLNGESIFYLQSPINKGIATVNVAYGKTKNSININFSDVNKTILIGKVINGDYRTPLPNVKIEISDDFNAITDRYGHYYIEIDEPRKMINNIGLTINEIGYYSYTDKLDLQSKPVAIHNVDLYAIADGVFFNTVYVLDSHSDEPTTHSLINRLKHLLEFAGAKVHSIHLDTINKTSEERIKTINAIKDEGYYLQIRHKKPKNNKPAVVAAHNRGNRTTEMFQKNILEQFNRDLFETPTETLQDRDTPVIQQTNKMAMTLEIGTLKYPDSSYLKEASVIFKGLWKFLSDSTTIDKEKFNRYMTYFEESEDM